MVKWSRAKERINEEGPYTFVKWLCANKINKSVWTLIFDRVVVHKRKIKWKRTIYFLSNGRGLQLYGIGSSRLVYKKVVEVSSNYISYKKS